MFQAFECLLGIVIGKHRMDANPYARAYPVRATGAGRIASIRKAVPYKDLKQVVVYHDSLSNSEFVYSLPTKYGVSDAS